MRQLDGQLWGRRVISDFLLVPQKLIRPEVINKVVEKYPEFYSDTGAFAILKDAVLLEKMIHSYQAKLIGDQYPILIKSAKFVAETMIAVMKKNPVNPAQRTRSTIYKHQRLVKTKF